MPINIGDIRHELVRRRERAQLELVTAERYLRSLMPGTIPESSPSRTIVAANAVVDACTEVIAFIDRGRELPTEAEASAEAGNR